MNGLGPGDWSEHVWYGSDEATLNGAEAKYFSVTDVLMLLLLGGTLWMLSLKVGLYNLMEVPFCLLE